MSVSPDPILEHTDIPPEELFEAFMPIAAAEVAPDTTPGDVLTEQDIDDILTRLHEIRHELARMAADFEEARRVHAMKLPAYIIPANREKVPDWAAYHVGIGDAANAINRSHHILLECYRVPHELFKGLAEEGIVIMMRDVWEQVGKGVSADRIHFIPRYLDHYDLRNQLYVYEGKEKRLATEDEREKAYEVGYECDFVNATIDRLMRDIFEELGNAYHGRSAAFGSAKVNMRAIEQYILRPMFLEDPVRLELYVFLMTTLANMLEPQRKYHIPYARPLSLEAKRRLFSLVRQVKQDPNEPFASRNIRMYGQLIDCSL